jgi:hypothetical protein
MITSEWGTPNMVEAGVNPEILLSGGYGHQLHIWDLRTRKHVEALDNPGCEDTRRRGLPLHLRLILPV